MESLKKINDYIQEKLDSSYTSITSQFIHPSSSSSSLDSITKEFTYPSKIDIQKNSSSESLNTEIIEDDNISILSSSSSSPRNAVTSLEIKDTPEEDKNNKTDDNILTLLQSTESTSLKNETQENPFTTDTKDNDNPSSSSQNIDKNPIETTDPNTESNDKNNDIDKKENDDEEDNRIEDDKERNENESSKYYFTYLNDIEDSNPKVYKEKYDKKPGKKHKKTYSTDYKNFKDTYDDLKKKAELKSGETQECNFIKSFIDCTLDEYGTCSSMEREIIEKLLMKQVPLLKNYEKIIINIESFIENIIVDINKNKEREHNFISNIEYLKSELKKSKNTIKDLNQYSKELTEDNIDLKTYSKNIENENNNLKEYIKTVEKELDELKEHVNTIEKENNSLKQYSQKMEKDNEDLEQDINKYKKYIKQLCKNEQNEAKLKKEEELEKEKLKVIIEKQDKAKEEECKKLKEELENVKMNERKKIKEELENVKMNERKKLKEEIERIIKEKDEELKNKIEKIKEERNTKLKEEINKVKEEENKKLQEGIEKIKEEEGDKLREEIKKIRKEERGKIKSNIEKMRMEERERYNEELTRIKKGNSSSNNNSLEPELINGNDLTSSKVKNETNIEPMNDIESVERVIISITNSTTDIIKRAVLIYDYLFKENLKPKEENKNKKKLNKAADDDDIKRLRHVYKSIIKKFQMTLETEIKKISTVRETYSEKVNEQQQQLYKLQQREHEIISAHHSEQQQQLQEQQKEQHQQLQQIIQQLKQEFIGIQNDSPKKWTEVEFFTNLEDTLKKYFEKKEDNSEDMTISYELKLPENNYYIIKKDNKDDLQNCVLFLNSVNESDTIKNLNIIFPSLKQFYHEVKSLNRILKLKEDLYKNDKLDDQHIIENNIQSINKLREELSNAKNALAETEQKCNNLVDEKNKVLEELENTTSHIELLENNINKKKGDLKEFLSEHNTLVSLYNTVVDEEKRKYIMLEEDYTFMKNHQIEYENKIKMLEEKNSSLLYELEHYKRNSKYKKSYKTHLYNY